jgi:hypothetical protein
MQFVIEALRIQGSLSPENFQGVPDVVLFLDSDLGKDLAETARRHPAHACVAGYSEVFKHDFLNNQATDEVPLGNAAQECLAKALPMLRVYVVRDHNSDSATLGSEGNQHVLADQRRGTSVSHGFHVSSFIADKGTGFAGPDGRVI